MGFLDKAKDLLSQNADTGIPATPIFSIAQLHHSTSVIEMPDAVRSTLTKAAEFFTPV